LSQILKSSIVVTTFTVLGMALNFICQMLIAAKFGATREMDIFFAATTIPLFLIGIISSSLSFTLIPIFAEYSERSSREVSRIISSLINLGLLFTGLLSLLGVWGAPQLIRITVPGFSGEEVIQAARLLQLLFSMVIFTVVNEILTCLYYSKQRFILPSLNRITSPIITIIYILIFQASLSVKSLALAMLFASLIQMVLLLIGILKSRDLEYFSILGLKHPDIVKIFKLILPLILGMVIYRTIPILDRFFLSKLPEGSIAHIGYATQLLNFIHSIVVSGITISLFPIMSQYAAKKNWYDLKKIISKGLRVLFFISVPFIFLFGLHSEPFIQLLWERGNFLSTDTASVHKAFIIYIWALPAMTMGTLIGQGFYVLQDTKTPVIIGIVESVLYVGLCYFMIPKFQYLAIPTAYLIYFYLSLFVCALTLRYKLGNQGGRLFVLTMLKNLCSVIIPLVTLDFAYQFFPGQFARIGLVLFSFLLYLLIGRFLFKTEEVSYVFDFIYQKLFKRVPSFLV